MGKLERKPTQDFAGMKINMLTVTEKVYRNGKPLWHCTCDCGKEIFVRHTRLTHGQKSCGCHASKMLVERNTKHSKRHSKLYAVWRGLRSRCNNSNHPFYCDYGGRGITVCKEWDNTNDGFQNFYDWSVKSGYKDDLSIDRIDNNGNYEPNNCRWATIKQQCNNRRSNIVLNYKGVAHTVSEWSEIIQVKSGTIYQRIYKGWNTGEILGFEYKKGRRTENGKHSINAT